MTVARLAAVSKPRPTSRLVLPAGALWTLTRRAMVVLLKQLILPRR